MAETAAVKRAEEPVKPIKYASAFDQIQDTFNAIARRAYEIFEGSGRAFGPIIGEDAGIGGEHGERSETFGL